MTTATKLEEFLDLFLEDSSFEDLLDYFDVSTYEALEVLFAEGLISEELVDDYIGRK